MFSRLLMGEIVNFSLFNGQKRSRKWEKIFVGRLGPSSWTCAAVRRAWEPNEKIYMKKKTGKNCVFSLLFNWQIESKKKSLVNC